jgi:Mg2+/Co2+ transporter CorB
VTTAHTVIWVLSAVIGLGGSALCNGMEIGLYSLNRVRLRLRAAGGDAAYSARLLGNNLFSYLAATALTAVMSAAGYGETAMVLIEVAILTPLLLVLAESLPKELFRADADRLVYLSPRTSPWPDCC